MPFYLVEQKGVPGARLIEADKPAGAINHVVGDTFSAKRVEGRELLDAAKNYDVEVAGDNKPSEPKPEPPILAAARGDEQADPDGDFKPGEGTNKEDE
jgi:hypothetical protein